MEGRSTRGKQEDDGMPAGHRAASYIAILSAAPVFGAKAYFFKRLYFFKS
jgi:hypothetical protein